MIREMKGNLNIKTKFICRFRLILSSTLTRKTGTCSQDLRWSIFPVILPHTKVTYVMQQYEGLCIFLEKLCSHRTKTCHEMFPTHWFYIFFCSYFCDLVKSTCQCKNITKYYNLILVELRRICGLLRIQWHPYSPI